MSPADRAAAPCAECGHVREAHEHYRRGADCALCDCARFSDRRRGAPAPRESGKVRRAVSGALRRFGRTGR